MKKDLTRNKQGINHFINLKNDFERNSDRILNSLPLFYRVMYLDQPNPWVNQINRFDFIRLAVVSNSFNSYHPFEINNFYFKRIKPMDSSDRFDIELKDFFQSNILKNESFEYNIHEFILCIGYTGGIHMLPDKKKTEFLYDNLFLINPDFIFDLVRDIAGILIDIYDEFYSLLKGSNDTHSPNNNFQAKTVENGKMLDGAYFEHAYMQIPIWAKKNKGIRFCLEIKLLIHQNENPILWYGHRKDDSLKIGITQNYKTIIVQIFQGNRPIKTIKHDISEIISDYFQLEVAVYPSGKISLATNSILRVVEDLENKVETINGKVILGSDLSAKKFGVFFKRFLVMQSIEKSNLTRTLGVYGFRRLPIESQNLPYQLLKRPL